MLPCRRRFRPSPGGCPTRELTARIEGLSSLVSIFLHGPPPVCHWRGPPVPVPASPALYVKSQGASRRPRQSVPRSWTRGGGQRILDSVLGRDRGGGQANACQGMAVRCRGPIGQARRFYSRTGGA